MRIPLTKEEDGTLSLEVPDDLLQKLTSLNLSQEPEAQLKESQSKVTELEEKIACLEEQPTKGAARTMDDFTPIEKATFVLTWGAELSPEEKATFARAVGITGASEAEVAEGKTDPEYYRQFGCRYCEHLVTVSAPGKPWIGGCRYKLSFPACGDKWELWSGMGLKGKAKVAQAEAEVAEEKPLIINGKTDSPGYKYFPHVGVSIKEKE